ncbi:Signal transduction histidine kinase [Fibrella aestuarina BUZ 2]|uniref:histidine kinase n=1 Tax=Fibrella aestuarina BUZ 2 TaxID=1166018 RepID=I0KC63_9BACT|nr:tetratricopeptide repeat protein [Fibrella aestuarina]CCH01716.1 Signal transduction histidine kinase [Fibrella aestuarina BUZ 2]
MKFIFTCAASALLLLTMATSTASAQQKQLDSLRRVLTLPIADTTRIHTLYDIANAFYKLGQTDSTGRYLSHLLQRSRQLNYQPGLGDYNRLQGALHMHRGLYREALVYYQAAITNYNKAAMPKATAQVYNNMGWLYKMMGDSQHVLSLTKQGLGYVQQAIAINQRFRPSTPLVDNYINAGILYEDLGQPELGRSYFLKAIAINDQVGAPPADYRVLFNNLGKNYHVTGQYRLAIGYLQQALAINLSMKKLSSLAHNYRNLASAYRGLKQPDSAVYFAEKALAAVRSAKESPLTSSVYGELALSHAAAGHYQKAYEAVAKHKQVEDSLMTLDKTRLIAQLQGQYESQQANTMATIKANLELAKTREIALVEAQKARAIALIQAEKTRRIAQIEATAEVEKTRAVADIQTKYETQKKSHRIAQLDQHNQQRAQQIKYMTAGLGVLLVLVSGLIVQYSTIRQTNRRLSVQNGIITTNSQQLISQADQLRVLMKELHHRVKNNLAIVSSLLKLQLNRLDDEKAIQAVRVGQQRVEAMSLIHQRLYQTDQLTTVNMAEYLDDLANSLIRAYGYQREAFDLQLNVDLPELDVDMAIPLGLIVNELATNSFKYAYQTSRRPLLRIELQQHQQKGQTGITLEVQDNGPGIADWPQLSRRDSFGKRLIMSLSEQLDGKGEWLQQNGTLFRLSIQHTRLAAA